MAATKGKHPIDKKVMRIDCTRGIPVGATLKCLDNTGNQILKVVGVKGVGGRLNKFPEAGPGDVVVCTIKKGKPEQKGTLIIAVVVSQKQVLKRKDGTRFIFETNGAVIINNKGEMKGTQVNGPMPREVAELWPRLGSQAANII